MGTIRGRLALHSCFAALIGGHGDLQRLQTARPRLGVGFHGPGLGQRALAGGGRVRVREHGQQ